MHDNFNGDIDISTGGVVIPSIFPVNEDEFVAHKCFYVLGIGCTWYELIATGLIWLAMALAFVLALVAACRVNQCV